MNERSMLNLSTDKIIDESEISESENNSKNTLSETWNLEKFEPNKYKYQDFKKEKKRERTRENPSIEEGHIIIKTFKK